jgi:hypothetical protein
VRLPWLKTGWLTGRGAQVAYLSLTDFVNEREVKKETEQAAERESRKLQKARAAPAKASTKGFGK